MKRIGTFHGPIPGLAEYRARAWNRASWQGYGKHSAGKIRYRKLIEALIYLQHGLCCYCEIDLRDDDRQVEHFVPRSHPRHGAALALSADNMLACCRGGSSNGQSAQGKPNELRELSCGQSKGNRMSVKFIDPRELPALPSLTRVFSDGRIEADEKACKETGFSVDSVNETISILGLNVERLRSERERRWRGLDDRWEAYRDNAEVMEAAARSELLPSGGGKLPRFFTTARSYFAPLSESILAEPPQAWI